MDLRSRKDLRKHPACSPQMINREVVYRRLSLSSRVHRSSSNNIHTIPITVHDATDRSYTLPQCPSQLCPPVAVIQPNLPSLQPEFGGQIANNKHQSPKISPTQVQTGRVAALPIRSRPQDVGTLCDLTKKNTHPKPTPNRRGVRPKQSSPCVLRLI